MRSPSLAHRRVPGPYPTARKKANKTVVVSSLIVEVMPDRLEAACLQLAAWPGVEVHGANENRLVVTIEAETVDESHDIASRFVEVDGVFGVNLVYANFEEDPTLKRGGSNEG